MYSGPNRKRQRLKEYDYSQNGAYFITICTKNRENYFGEIVDGEMILNEYGLIIENCWKQIIEHFQDLVIDEFIIMPNHIHGIIMIIKDDNINSIKNQNINVGNEYFRSISQEGNINKEIDLNNRNENIRSLQKMNSNLSSIIKGFKIGCTKEIRNRFEDYNFAWQKSFYDEIIRDEEQLNKTIQYIIENPLKWEFDKNNLINIL